MRLKNKLALLETSKAILIIILISSTSYAQIIDDITTLENLVIQKHSNQLNSELTAHKKNKTFDYLNFIPSVNYDFVRNNYYLSVHVSDIVGFFEKRHNSKQKKKSIKQVYSVTLEEKLTRLKSNYLYINHLIHQLQEDIEVYKLQKQLFKLKEESYKAEEIPIKEYLEAKIKIKKERQSLHALENRIRLKSFDIEELTSKELNYKIPNY